MAYIREETLDNFTEEELLQMFKDSLDELGIAYEEGPGDWGDFLRLDPADFEAPDPIEAFTIRTYAPRSPSYRSRSPKIGDFKLTFSSGWGEETAPVPSVWEEETEPVPSVA